MHLRLLGDTQDATGFALAGVDSEVCDTRAQLVRALDHARRDPSVAILVLSASVAALADDVVGQMRHSAHLPITVVLPAVPEAERPRDEKETRV